MSAKYDPRRLAVSIVLVAVFPVDPEAESPADKSEELAEDTVESEVETLDAELSVCAGVVWTATGVTCATITGVAMACAVGDKVWTCTALVESVVLAEALEAFSLLCLYWLDSLLDSSDS